MNKKELRKRNSYADREVLNLTGNLYPFALFSQTKPLNHQKWVQETQKKQRPESQNKRKDQFLQERKSIKIQNILNQKKEEISIDNDWSFEETQYLFN
ncbi:unnamed protein product [Paramecium pentaurelia]|uniref:Uncharacterized protein n=1 Tax=Paramecium pentaurelia TaxID=43138 RepID=A0A8S1VRI9_9CILI|nr:unnamed protein product [Paramecium pentaurelia]